MTERPPTTTCFVGNVAYGVTEDQLRELFREVGPVKSFRREALPTQSCLLGVRASLSPLKPMIGWPATQASDRPRHWQAKGLWLLRVL